MPTFKYVCEVCGEHVEAYDPLANCPAEPVCAACRAKAGHERMSNTQSKASTIFEFNVGNKEYAKPIISQSLAINPTQAAEHRATFPNIELKDDQFPVFDNYQDHDAYLKQTGFVKQKMRTTRQRTRFGIGNKRVTLSDVRRRLETEKGNAEESVLPPEQE